jgi:hypothetical protein
MIGGGRRRRSTPEIRLDRLSIHDHSDGHTARPRLLPTRWELGVAIDATGSLIAELKDGVEDGTMLDGARSPARSKKLLSVGHHIAAVQPSPSMDSDSRNRPIEKSATQFVNAGFLGFSSTGLLPAAEHVGIEVYSVA